MPIVNEDEVRGPGKRPRLYGWICTMDDGRKAYFARRKHREIYRGGKSSISGAMKEEVAAWAIDETLLMSLRAKSIEFIGVRVEDTGDIYLARMSLYFDRKVFKTIDFIGIGRGGSRQRIVPISKFTLRKGAVALDHNALY